MGVKIQLFDLARIDQIYVCGDGWKAKSAKKK